MASHSSASMREQAPHSINSITYNTLKFNRITDHVRQRARDVIQDKSLHEGSRNLIRYALEIDDPALPELVRRADAGESIHRRLTNSLVGNTSLLRGVPVVSCWRRLTCRNASSIGSGNRDARVYE